MIIYPFCEKDLQELLSPYLNSYFVFLETAIFDKNNFYSFLFKEPNYILDFNFRDDPQKFFKKIEYFLNKGFWLAGYFTYEFGYFLEPALANLRENYSFPLVWLGVFKEPIIIDHRLYKPSFKDKKELKFSLEDIRANIYKEEYGLAIKKIKNYLEEGLTYQVNFTFKLKFKFKGNILDFYFNLRRNQPTSYMALINTKNNYILSLSPELFFKKERDQIVSSPMKGTTSRGLTLEEDEYKKKWLKEDKKSRAENIMIVDLLRNDLGRISNKVSVSKLFNVEKYRTVYQMTSTIEGLLKKNLKIKEIFSSLFPCGSVTGAPKIKTMYIIKELEKEPRNVYTGAIGFISPKRKMCFNVAIRTIFLKEKEGELGVGGGIVYDSLEKSEFKEALLKANFLTKRLKKFYLIESILFDCDKGYFLLNSHLKRLKNSSKYFLIPLDLEYIKTYLEKLKKSTKIGKFKVRILVNLEGRITIEKEPLEEIKLPVKIKISSIKINPENIFLYHKTNERTIYNREGFKAKREGFFEVIFTNKKGELTEGSFTNIFLKKNGKLYTPPIKCGLLKGVLREYFLANKKVEEKVLYLKDIFEAEKLYVGNSVRGLLEAKI